MPRTGENIYKRKDGRWEGRYIKTHLPSGKTVYGYLYARTYRDLKEKMLCQERLKNKPHLSSSPTFQTVAEEWITSRQPHLKEASIVKYRNLLNTYIFPEMGNEKILLLNYEQMDTFCHRMLTAGGKNNSGLSPKTVSDILSLIRCILQYASEKGNPAGYNGKSLSIRQEPKDLRILSLTEQKKLYTFLYSSEDCRDVGILISMFTGLRIGEICTLKWQDISFSEKTLFVHQTMQRLQTDENEEKKTKILISTPKSQCSIRIIPLPQELCEYLLLQQKPADAYLLTGTAFQYIEPRNMQNRFRKVTELCGIKNVNFHCLRHTFATRCIEAGFDIKSLSEILGHANVNITMNRYVHPSLELKRENMNRLTNLFAVR